jgi:Short C-terminal domain
MKPSPIRELARRYASGELSLDEYRAQRRRLIDGVTSGIQKLEYGGPSSPHREQSYYLRLSSGIALLVAATAVGMFLWVHHIHKFKQSTLQSINAAESGPILVRSFIETNDWSDASIMQFLRHWKALPSDEQKAASQSYLFPRLLSQLGEQIASQQAVVDLAADGSNNADPASIHLAHLQQLASSLAAKPGE